MLSSLAVKNYRNLKSLEIDSLSRVNLIAGKNNTGKTSLLEAVHLYATKGDLQWINDILLRRNEIIYKSGERFERPRIVDSVSYEALFYDRNINFHNHDRITIGELSDSLFGKDVDSDKSLTIRFVKFLREKIESSSGENIIRTKILEKDDERELEGIEIGLDVKFGAIGKVHYLNRERVRGSMLSSINTLTNFNVQFVKTGDIESNFNGNLWDNVALTEAEAFIVEALRIVDSEVERITFVNDDLGRQRNPVVKLKDQKKVLPLKSMGDGMNRILTIILALVNVENGHLLIDEFENGLHYTVQEDLWKIVFKLAEELNVQVFATTHSNDCIRAFENVLNSGGNQNKGQFLRLDKINEDIIATPYTASELKTATEHFIEVR